MKAILLALTMALALAAGAPAGQRPSGVPETPGAIAPADDESAYMCPMHPDYTSERAGTCPRCGMNLVLATPFDMRDDQLEFQTLPSPVKAGAPVTLIFNVLRPGSHEQVRQFELVHDRPYHLFVISQDMSQYLHVHPEQRPDGRWAVNITLPVPGYYKVLSDFLPKGGSPQFIARPLVTAGFTADLIDSSAHLEPDQNLTKTVDDMTARVSYEPQRFVAGLYGHVTFHLTDTATGAPLHDLQTYLGAFGHSLIMSEDMVDYVHSHPIDTIPPGTDLEQLRGGPDVTFEGLIPKPGRYRVWTQFRRHGTIHTFAYTFTAIDVGELSRQ